MYIQSHKCVQVVQLEDRHRQMLGNTVETNIEPVKCSTSLEQHIKICNGEIWPCMQMADEEAKDKV